MKNKENINDKQKKVKRVRPSIFSVFSERRKLKKRKAKKKVGYNKDDEEFMDLVSDTYLQREIEKDLFE